MWIPSRTGAGAYTIGQVAYYGVALSAARVAAHVIASGILVVGTSTAAAAALLLAKATVNAAAGAYIATRLTANAAARLATTAQQSLGAGARVPLSGYAVTVLADNPVLYAPLTDVS